MQQTARIRSVCQSAASAPPMRSATHRFSNQERRLEQSVGEAGNSRVLPLVSPLTSPPPDTCQSVKLTIKSNQRGREAKELGGPVVREQKLDGLCYTAADLHVRHVIECSTSLHTGSVAEIGTFVRLENRKEKLEVKNIGRFPLHISITQAVFLYSIVNIILKC